MYEYVVYMYIVLICMSKVKTKKDVYCDLKIIFYC